MPETGELRRIAWTQTFPFLRLFRATRYSIGPQRLALALAAVVLIYLAGRLLDGIWGQRGGAIASGAPRAAIRDECEAYATLNADEFEAWKLRTLEQNREIESSALAQAGLARNVDEAREKLSKTSALKLLEDDSFGRTVADLRRLPHDRLRARLAEINADKTLSAEEKARRRERARHVAQVVRLMLSGQPGTPADAAERQAGIAEIVNFDPNVDLVQRQKDTQRLTEAMNRFDAISRARLTQRRGPFAAMLDTLTREFGMAVRGALSGRLGFAEAADDARPALLGNLAKVGYAPLWLLTQHPWFAILFGLIKLLILALLCGAICRSAAVVSARDEEIPLSEAVKFARQHYLGFVGGPAIPVAGVLGLGALVLIGGFVANILPWIGELVAGLLMVLAIVGGVAMSVVILGTLLGFPVLWSTVAVEATSPDEAVSRALSYSWSRFWNILWYGLVLAFQGAVVFTLIRLVITLALKLTHMFAAVGLGAAQWVYDYWRGPSQTLGELNDMWRMPAWSDLPLLPTGGDVPLHGWFYNAPLSVGENIGAFFIAAWVFLLVSVLAAWTISFFCCGATEMFFLLRRDEDATDYEEIYYEEADEYAEAMSGESAAIAADGAAVTPPPAGGPGQQLTVMGNPPAPK